MADVYCWRSHCGKLDTRSQSHSGYAFCNRQPGITIRATEGIATSSCALREPSAKMKNKRNSRTPVFALTMVLIGAASIAASLSGARASEGETYALRGGTIVTVTGATIPNGTLVIRDGLIADIGQGIAIPGDAS